MKKFLLVALITGLLLSSCSKNSSNPTPVTNSTITITDSVKIGTLTWTTVNYSGNGGFSYNNDPANDAVYGKLYTFTEATAIKLPSGWRIPTTADFNNLLHSIDPSEAIDAQGNYQGSATDAAALMSTKLWLSNFGTNSSGFNAVPAGFSFTDSNSGTSNTANDVRAVFITSSPFTFSSNSTTYTGHANFFIYQDNSQSPIVTSALISSIDASNNPGQGLASIRFVKND